MSLSKIDDSKRAKIVKISESMWKFTYFFTVVVWALSVVYNKPWSRDNIDFFRGWPDHQLESVLDLLSLSLYAFISLCKSKTKLTIFILLPKLNVVKKY